MFRENKIGIDDVYQMSEDIIAVIRRKIYAIAMERPDDFESNAYMQWRTKLTELHKLRIEMMMTATRRLDRLLDT